MRPSLFGFLASTLFASAAGCASPIDEQTSASVDALGAPGVAALSSALVLPHLGPSADAAEGIVQLDVWGVGTVANAVRDIQVSVGPAGPTLTKVVPVALRKKRDASGHPIAIGDPDTNSSYAAILQKRSDEQCAASFCVRLGAAEIASVMQGSPLVFRTKAMVDGAYVAAPLRASLGLPPAEMAEESGKIDAEVAKGAWQYARASEAIESADLSTAGLSPLAIDFSPGTTAEPATAIVRAKHPAIDARVFDANTRPGGGRTLTLWTDGPSARGVNDGPVQRTGGREMVSATKFIFPVTTFRAAAGSRSSILAAFKAGPTQPSYEIRGTLYLSAAARYIGPPSSGPR